MANNTAQTRNAAQPKQSRIIRIIAIVFLALIVLAALTVIIIWLTIRPKRLVYSIENGSIHNYNFTNGHLNANFHFTIRAYNPNSKVSIYYDKIQATAYYDDETIATNSIETFHQPRRNVAHLGLDLSAKNASLSDSAARDLRMERVSGRLNMEIKVKAKIRFKVGIWKSRHRTLRVLCGPVNVPFSSYKNFDTTICDVDL